MLIADNKRGAPPLAPARTAMARSFRASIRIVADGLVAKAGGLPEHSRAARLLRDAASSLLDADLELEREGE
jgi:hypothetical protein